eukprot:TRINITY_DN2895_c0_g5_i1.p1 TRINITY_DN2895_c0_g5~~TRINITY_DN2895_c0_g5_i1.p1  ORF type:complete len:496 (+),score=182.00 TRINITY_DN2895_c0_g5_i1:104-1591(+)
MVSSTGSDKPVTLDASGTPTVVFNLANTLLGAGMLSLPYAWKETGFVMSFLIFIGVAMISEYAVVSLITMADPLCRKGEIYTVCYEQLAERILGVWGRRTILFAQFLQAWGIGIAYLVAVANELTTGLVGVNVLSSPIPHSQRMLVLCVAAAVLFPIMCLRTVRGLRFVSLFCCFCAVGLIFVVGFELASNRDEICLTTIDELKPGTAGNVAVDKCVHDYDTFGKLSFFSVMGTFVFGLACQHTMFPIYRSLGSNASPSRWRRASMIALTVVVGINILSAMLTYRLFGESVQSDFFLSFGEDSKLPGVIVGRFVFGAMLMMSFPIQEFIARETLQVIIADWMDARKQGEKQPLVDADCEKGNLSPVSTRSPRSIYSTPHGIDKIPDDDKSSAAGGMVREATSNAMHYSTTALLFGTCLGVALITDTLGSVLTLTGGIAGSTTAFILPGLLAFHCEAETGIPPLGGSVLGKWLGCACAVFGVVIAVSSSVFTFVTV